MRVLREACEKIDEFLMKDDEHVVAVHCKAGKGRTGLIVCAYMLYKSFKHPAPGGMGGGLSAAEVMDQYAVERTHNSKGLTIPSQRRYVEYFEAELRGSVPDSSGERRLQRVVVE